MPHLAPMSWTLALILVWFFITMINSLSWWSSPMKFSFYNSFNKSSVSHNWTW